MDIRERDFLGDVAARPAFLLQSGDQLSPRGAIGFDLDAGILGFERFDYLFVRVSREGRIPNNFSFAFGSRVK